METGKAAKTASAEDIGRLSTRDHWEDRWRRQKFSVSKVSFDPSKPMFADLHALFARSLPVSAKMRFLEVGCFPGYYLWYFNRYFEYAVAGLEYVESCCTEAAVCLRREGVSADVMHADFFDYSIDPSRMTFDVVASFGFVEHFSDYTSVIEKHLNLVSPGGYLLLTIPNHQGIYGDILRAVDREKFETHNRMTLADIRAALDQIGGTELVEEGYFGRLGFWNSGVYSWAQRLGKGFYPLVRAPLWCVEKAGRLLPNSTNLSPIIASIVRKNA